MVTAQPGMRLALALTGIDERPSVGHELLAPAPVLRMLLGSSSWLPCDGSVLCDVKPHAARRQPARTHLSAPALGADLVSYDTDPAAAGSEEPRAVR